MLCFLDPVEDKPGTLCKPGDVHALGSCVCIQWCTEALQEGGVKRGQAACNDAAPCPLAPTSTHTYLPTGSPDHINTMLQVFMAPLELLPHGKALNSTLKVRNVRQRAHEPLRLRHRKKGQGEGLVHGGRRESVNPGHTLITGHCEHHTRVPYSGHHTDTLHALHANTSTQRIVTNPHTDTPHSQKPGHTYKLTRPCNRPEKMYWKTTAHCTHHYLPLGAPADCPCTSSRSAPQHPWEWSCSAPAPHQSDTGYDTGDRMAPYLVNYSTYRNQPTVPGTRGGGREGEGGGNNLATKTIWH